MEHKKSILLSLPNFRFYLKYFLGLTQYCMQTYVGKNILIIENVILQNMTYFKTNIISINRST